MTHTEIFAGISTTELLSYLAHGDNSKELRAELKDRAKDLIKSREGKINNIELDAKYNG